MELVREILALNDAQIADKAILEDIGIKNLIRNYEQELIAKDRHLKDINLFQHIGEFAEIDYYSLFLIQSIQLRKDYLRHLEPIFDSIIKQYLVENPEISSKFARLGALQYVFTLDNREHDRLYSETTAYRNILTVRSGKHKMLRNEIHMLENDLDIWANRTFIRDTDSDELKEQKLNLVKTKNLELLKEYLSN